MARPHAEERRFTKDRRADRPVWLWISNIAVLLGAELNAELKRGRELEAGLPAHDALLLEPGDAPKVAQAAHGRMTLSRPLGSRAGR
jgi:hypothetical protein